jgi:hypothetical protein
MEVVMQALSINRDGTRYVIPGRKVRVVGEIDGKPYDKLRVARYYEQFGNWAVTCVRIGKTNFVGFEREDETGESVLMLNVCRKN